jgi:hypothetical protein
MDNKKKLLIVLGIVEAAILVFCLIVSILVLRNFYANDTGRNISENGVFIGTLQNNHVLFFCTIVLPVFVIFLADGAYLIVYANKKASMLGDKEKKAIEEEAKRQAREEVLKELQQDDSAAAEKKPEEKPADQPETK